jgi:hypothetical protein
MARDPVNTHMRLPDHPISGLVSDEMRTGPKAFWQQMPILIGRKNRHLLRGGCTLIGCTILQPIIAGLVGSKLWRSQRFVVHSMRDGIVIDRK